MITIALNDYPDPYLLAGNKIMLDLAYTISTPGNYALHCRVCKADDDTVIGEEMISAYYGGSKIIFDVSEYVFSYLKNNRTSTLTHFTNSTYYLHSSHSFSFYLKYTFSIDGNIEGWWNGDICTAFLGGMSVSKINQHGTFNGYFSGLLKPSLSWVPDNKLTSKSAIERFYFFNTAGSIAKIKFRLYFNDGSIQIINDTIIYGALSRVYEIDAGYRQAWDQFPSKIWKYQIWIADANDAQVTVSKTFIIDHSYYRNEQQFAFLNSLGAYDFIRCTGRLISKPTFERSEFEDEDRNRLQFLNIIENNYTANTGSVSLQIASWLDELFLSRQVFWLVDNAMMPVIITSSKKTQISDDQRRFNISFDFSLSQKSEYA